MNKTILDVCGVNGKLKECVVKDLKIIIANSNLGEIREIHSIAKLIEEFQDKAFEGVWTDTCKMVYFYKLGVMYGKRIERARRLKVSTKND